MRRHWFDALFGPLASLLAVGILALGAFTVAVIVPDLRGPEASPSAAPVESPTTPPMRLMRVPVPADADCRGCHTVVDGTIGTQPIPAMAHPVEGWRDCTACHADDRLVETAPGHTGIHRDLCLMCHVPLDPDASALPRAHHVVAGEACITCHGPSATAAPLPTDMAGRQNCWICHIGTDAKRLWEDAVNPATPGP